MVCKAELRGLAARHADFAKAGAKLVSITADTPDRIRDFAQKLPYPLLHDRELKVTRQYTEIHAKAGPDGSDVARPTTVIVGRNGKVKWLNVYNDIRTRPDPEDVLRILGSK